MNSAPILERDSADVSALQAILDRFEIRRWDAAVLLSAIGFIVAFAPWLLFDAWTPRMALVLLWLPLGLYALVMSARAGDLPARLLAVALGGIVISSLVSGNAWGSLIGIVGRDLSALMFAGCAALWAAARRLTTAGRSMLTDVVIWAAFASAVVGVIQVVVDVQTGTLALQSGRPAGLAVNPVFFGAICAAGLLMACVRLVDGTHRWGPLVIAVLGLSIGTSLSGSRVALAATVVLVVVLVATRRTFEAVVVAGLAGIGLCAGVVLDRVAGGGSNAAARLTAGDGGGRTTVWRYGWDAVWERPLLGHGIGRFRPAVQADFEPSFVNAAVSDELRQAWFDPHNAGLLLLVGVGLIGTILIGAWAVASALRCRGPQLWGTAALAITWLLQPVALATLPLAMILFGAALRPVRPGEPVAQGVLGRRLAGWLAAIGCVLGAYLVIADALLDRAADAVDPGLAEVAAAMYGRDPTVGDVVAQVHEFDGDLAEALDWRRRTADWGPDRPYWWTQLADIALRVGSVDEADRAVAAAFELQPNNVRTSTIDARLAIARQDVDRLGEALDQLCALGRVVECELDPADVLESANG